MSRFYGLIFPPIIFYTDRSVTIKIDLGLSILLNSAYLTISLSIGCPVCDLNSVTHILGMVGYANTRVTALKPDFTNYVAVM